MGLFPSTTERLAVTMTRGPKKHLKRLAAPKTWMLDKLGGVFTTRPSSGPHKMRESMPIRYPDPVIKVNDSIRLDINTNKIMDFIKFEAGNLCMVTGGRNTGRVGSIMHREKHPGSFDIVHVKDANGHTFATRLGYIFVIGKGAKPYISLPKGGGVKLSIAEERDKRLST